MALGTSLTCRPLEPRVDRFTLQRQHPKHAFVHFSERFLANESFQCLDSQCKFPQSKRSLTRHTALPKALEICGARVFRTVDDPQVFFAPALDCRLNHASFAVLNERQGLDHHPLGSGLCYLVPPESRFSLSILIGQIDLPARS